MKKFFVLFLLVLAGIPDARAQDTLTVVSYNIYHGEQAYEAGKSNLKDVAELINELRPDFVVLQEVDSLTRRTAEINNGGPMDMVNRLSQLTGMHGYFGKAIDYDGGGYGQGMLTKSPLQLQRVRLPSPEGGEPRIMLYAEAQTASGTRIIMGGTHLCHLHAENRLAQVKAINSSLLESGRPALIAGDFNFTADSESYKEMSKTWIDAAKVYRGSPQPTLPGRNPTKRIDYLFLSESSQWKVLDVQVPDVEYSDHRPVVATLILNPGNRLFPE